MVDHPLRREGIVPARAPSCSLSCWRPTLLTETWAATLPFHCSESVHGDASWNQPSQTIAPDKFRLEMRAISWLDVFSEIVKKLERLKPPPCTAPSPDLPTVRNGVAKRLAKVNNLPSPLRMAFFIVSLSPRLTSPGYLLSPRRLCGYIFSIIDNCWYIRLGLTDAIV